MEEGRVNDWAFVERLPQRERTIWTLLDWYVDVVNGLQDGNGGGDGLALMCRAWNHPSYQELERRRLHMQRWKPETYWHLAERFFRYQQRRVLRCPRCKAIDIPAGSSFSADGTSSRYHKHGRDSVLMVPFVLKEWSLAVDPVVVKRGVHWLANHWHGEPFLPDELLARAA